MQKSGLLYTPQAMKPQQDFVQYSGGSNAYQNFSNLSTIDEYCNNPYFQQQVKKYDQLFS